MGFFRTTFGQTGNSQFTDAKLNAIGKESANYSHQQLSGIRSVEGLREAVDQSGRFAGQYFGSIYSHEQLSAWQFSRLVSAFDIELRALGLPSSIVKAVSQHARQCGLEMYESLKEGD